MAKKYEPIWKELRDNLVVSIAAPIPLHRKIIKEVIRVKDLDVMFKYECSEKRIRYVLTYRREGAKITFCLTKELVLKNLSTADF